MPVKEQATIFDVLFGINAAISTNTTTAGPIIDTADYDAGITFAFGPTAYTDGTYTLKIEDGDNSGLSDAAVVDSAQLVYGTLPALTAAIAAGGKLAKEGVHSTKRYVRASIVSTAVTTGATVALVAIAGVEILKAAQQ